MTKDERDFDPLKKGRDERLSALVEHSFDAITLAAESFARLSGRLLFGFASHPPDTKNHILRNFIARTITMVRSVMALWEIGNLQDCWIIHRCIVGRYFRLVFLGKTASHKEFDDWSFMEQFEAQNRVRSDPNCQSVRTSPLFTPTSEQKARHASLAKSRPRWKRPRAEDVAKELNLPFLYAYSFDYAFCYVHPMANDGEEDFFTITKLEPKPEFPSQISVLHNSLLVSCLLVNEDLNQSDFKWRTDVYDF